MNIKKEILEKLKVIENCLEYENYEAATLNVKLSIDMLDRSIKDDDERASDYIDKLVKDLK